MADPVAAVLIQPRLLQTELTGEELILCERLVDFFNMRMQNQRLTVAAQAIGMLTGMYIDEARNQGDDGYVALADLAARAQGWSVAGDQTKRALGNIRRKAKRKSKTRGR
jgi:hypothetical protein